MKFFKKLVGDTIYLSPRSADAAEICAEWMNDFQVTDYTGRSFQIVSIDNEIEYFEKNVNSPGDFFIVTLEDDKLIGTIGFKDIDNINRCAELGIMIGNENYRGKGIGKEAIKLLLDFGFNYLNLNSVNLCFMEFNERARKCYTSCGFKEAGRIRQCKYINGKYYDSIKMDILKEEFTGSYIRNKNI